MTYHDPREFIRGLQQILVSDSKKIGFLAGAGTSMVKERPSGGPLILGTDGMTKKIRLELDKTYKAIFDQLEKEIEGDNKQFTLENIISKISQKELVVGDEKLCGLNKKGLKELREAIEKLINNLVSVHNEKDFFDWNLTHYKFVQWVNDANRKSCIEVFTTNYDYLFEIAFEKYNIPFFDGFVGSYKPFFFSEAVEDDLTLPQWTKLWKVHGSLGWEHDTSNGKIIKGDRNSSSIIIYPSILKYDKSKKQPFLSYLDRLGSFVRSDDAVLFISGYSFGDDHINDVILNALGKGRTSSIIVFLFDDFTEKSAIAEIAKNQTRLSVYGKRNAVIGGKFGCWKLKSEPSDDEVDLLETYFGRDMIDVFDAGGKKIGTKPDCLGDFKLVDFSQLTNFLSELSYINYVKMYA